EPARLTANKRRGNGVSFIGNDPKAQQFYYGVALTGHANQGLVRGSVLWAAKSERALPRRHDFGIPSDSASLCEVRTPKSPREATSGHSLVRRRRVRTIL